MRNRERIAKGALPKESTLATLYIEWGVRRRRFPNTSQRCRRCLHICRAPRVALGQFMQPAALRGNAGCISAAGRRPRVICHLVAGGHKVALSCRDLEHRWSTTLAPARFLTAHYLRAIERDRLSLSLISLAHLHQQTHHLLLVRALGINGEYITNSTLAPAVEPAAKSGWCVSAPRRWQALTVREHQTPKWSFFLADATPQLPDSVFSSSRMRAWQIGCAGRLWQLDQFKLRHSNLGLGFNGSMKVEYTKYKI